ncbi:MAG TPA: division/cell wall cluster transcriptional repressor MraZ [Terriglobia bacterium]|nr:division/cell wall cluster transcriptional repressor MraZ [Terriglobia bacterium]
MHKATVDPKGRLKIPAEFKEIIDREYGPNFYVTSLRGDKASVYPFSKWERIENRLAELPTTDPARNKFLDRVNFWGQQTQMDAQGRILIPAQLRESASVTGEVVVVGYPERLDVCKRESFAKRMEEEPITAADEQAWSNFGL